MKNCRWNQTAVRKFYLFLGVFILGGCLLMEAPANTPKGSGNAPLTGMAETVRHELVMLPFYHVFENLTFQIEEDKTVILGGQVTRPTLKSDAENVVAKLPGVNRVVNQIEVLPLSSFDNQIRRCVYRAIYSSPVLDRYAHRSIPSIHIIVKNGNVALEGVVANLMDKHLAEIAANGVSGVFKVENRLAVEK